MESRLSDHWFRATVIYKSEVFPAKIFSPGATVSVGGAAPNDFHLPDFELPTLEVVTRGTTLHLEERSEVRMSGWGGVGFVVLGYHQGSTATAVQEKVNFVIRPGLALLLQYHPTRELAMAAAEEYEGHIVRKKNN